MTQAQMTGRAPVRVVFDGQSHNVVPAAPLNFPTLLMSGRGIPWSNVALGGWGWSELAATAVTRLFPLARPDLTDILVMTGGQGDIIDPVGEGGQQTGAVTYARAVAYKDAAKAAGFDLVLMATCPPMGPNMLGTGRPTPSEAAAIVDYNALVLANSGGFDAVVDISVAPMNDSSNLTYYLFDQLHFAEAGAAAVAALMAPALESLLP